MNQIKWLALASVALLVTACGGGNDGRVDTRSSSSSSSSSQSAASEPYANCAEAEGGVFINNACSPWRDVSAYEQHLTTYAGREVTDGNGDAVSFSIINTSDPAHNQVIDIQYKEQSDYSAVVRLLTPEDRLDGLDMSEFATGSVVFDLKVINAGTENPDVEFNIDCIYPCASTHKLIKSYELNQWQTIEVPVWELVELGLDLTQVTAGFMINPTWRKQAGAHYQVDNIRWEKGDHEITETICFANHFDVQWVAGVQGPGIYMQDVNFIIPESEIMGATIGVHPVELIPNWSLMQGIWAYSMSEAISYQTGELLVPSTLSECSSTGRLSLDIYVPRSYVDDGSLTFTLHAVDNSLVRYELSDTVFSMADMTPDDWNRVSIPLSAETYHENLKYVGLTIDSTSIDPSITDPLKIDNILIKHPIAE